RERAVPPAHLLPCARGHHLGQLLRVGLRLPEPRNVIQHAAALRLARRADQRLDAALVGPYAADAAEQGLIAGQAGQAAAAELRLLPAVTVRVGVGCWCHGADYNGSRPGPPT